jgi:hypothetical protein
MYCAVRTYEKRKELAVSSKRLFSCLQLKTYRSAKQQNYTKIKN